MTCILVASAKGGVGKTTISTTLAGALAREGKPVILADADPQGSSLSWCAKREVAEAPVLGVDATRRGWEKKCPEGAGHTVIDAPAGAMPKSLSKELELADVVIVPILPSVLDMEAAVRFINALADVPRIAQGQLPVGLVANRLKPRTQASQQMVGQLSDWPCELVAQLRDSQLYVLLAGLGKSLFDFSSENARAHQEDWEPLLQWLRRK